MATRFYAHTKSYFEGAVISYLRDNNLGFIKEVTFEKEFQEPIQSWERIYSVSTRNPSVDLLIFSSIDIETNRMRDYATDAVRVVMRWKTKNGYVYRRVAKHQRISTLFSNLCATILYQNSTVFDLNYRMFVPAESVWAKQMA